MENDRSYFTRRASEERSAAERTEGKARQAHAEMAERYRILAENEPSNDAPHPVG